MDVTRECVSCILELREILLSFQTSFNLVNAAESWILAAELQRRIQAMEMKCYRKILHISYADHVTNEDIRAKNQQAIGPHEDLLTIVKRHKLQWYGHVSRSSGLAKTILQGIVKGERRQGGQRKRWEDNIREWTGLEFIIIIIINPLTARVVEAPQMTLQPVFFFSPVLHCPLGLAELQACPFPYVVFPPLPLTALSSSPFHCALQGGFGQTR